MAMIITANAQIPNKGFEQWSNMGNYWEPQGYVTPNAFASGAFYPVTRSTDHYPVSIGSYSIRLESKTSLLPGNDALGITLQNNYDSLLAGPCQYFKIIGHPTSLTGYYKYEPQNGDTMLIAIRLFQGGSFVSWGQLTTTASVPNWTSFNIPISSYSSADSGAILLASYNAIGPPPEKIPHGNSVLYVDNLNFDTLVSSVPDLTVKNALFNLYPNPASDIVNLSINNTNKEDLILNIYNAKGVLVRTETLKQNKPDYRSGRQQINIGDLSNGIYMVEIKSQEGTEKQKLIIQK